MPVIGGPVTGTGFLLGTANSTVGVPTYGNLGNTLTVTPGSNVGTLIVGDLYDGIRRWFTSDYIYGANGNDTIWGDSGSYVGAYSDSEARTAEPEYGGSDDIYGGKGNDWIHGGGGYDRIYGGEGNDTIYDGFYDGNTYGGLGNDRVYGGFGVEWIYGEGGSDTLLGEAGNDKLYGDSNTAGATSATTSADFLSGGAGLDNIYGGHGRDTIYGGSENDYITGGFSGSGAIDDHDVISGGTGNDSIYGMEGHDVIYGNEDDDRIEGNEGNDRMDGGTGSDTLRGGDGSDQYQFSNLPAGTKDTIQYFQEVDTIAFKKTVFTGLGTTLTAGEFKSVATTAGVARSQLDADDRLIFVRGTETLWYDRDGNGAAAAVEIAFVDLDSSSVVVDISDFRLF